jgi:lipopolysaccharide assembly outer membrane protein LptD (OstA)
VNFFDKLKNNSYKLKYKTILKIIVLAVIFVSGINFRAKAQVPAKKPVPIDTTQINKGSMLDSLSIGIESDSIKYSGISKIPQDTLMRDSIPPQPVGDIKTTVHYKALDSLTLNMLTKDVKMYGQANIDYTPISISAEEITVNWEDNMMMAEGKVDSTGRKYGTPIFVNGADTYETDEIRYNFSTEKAAIKGLVTKQGEGFIHADKVFKNAKGELFNSTTLYTTCNLAHPHYSIKARKVKVIPGKEMITGPFNMVLNDVPTPIGFAFGIFPDQQERNSGVIFPTFGEETRRGFYLRQGGYYFAINDYVNLELTGDIYTKGGWGIRAASSYTKRYSYRGNLLFDFTKLKTEDESTLETTVSNDFRFSWSHTPASKGTGRFSASVDLASSTYNLNNQLANQNDQIKTNLSSSVNYSKSFAGTPLSLGLSARFNQNLNTKLANILLPDFNFNVQNIYPFKRKASSGKAWYEKIVFRYAMTATNKITNRIITVDGDSIVELNSETLPLLVKQGSNGFNHTIPVSASLNLFKHFKLNPRLDYQERWYFKKLDYRYDEKAQKVVTDTLNGFNALRSYSAGVGISSVIYGTAFFKRPYGIQAIRHQMIPSISYSYQPDFGDPKFGYYQEVQKDSLGNTSTLARYAGFVYGQPRRGESSNISLSISNTLEMKVLSRKDTTGKAEKIILLRSFNLSTSYNLAADSFNLSPISLSAATNILNNKDLTKGVATTGFNVNFRGTIDPYMYVLDSIKVNKDIETIYQRRLNQFAFNNGQGLGQFSSLNIAITTGFRGKSKGSSQGSRGQGAIERTPTNSVKEEQELQEFINNPDLYVDFKIPWSVRLSYSLNYRRIGFKEGKVTQSLRFSGDLSLTPKWKTTFNSGYDIEKKRFSETRLGITRDLHCWEMRLDWVPYGRYQSYNFTIRAKSSLLQDLKISRRRNATDSFTFQ